MLLGCWGINPSKHTLLKYKISKVFEGSIKLLHPVLNSKKLVHLFNSGLFIEIICQFKKKIAQISFFFFLINQFIFSFI